MLADPFIRISAVVQIADLKEACFLYDKLINILLDGLEYFIATYVIWSMRKLHNGLIICFICQYLCA